jgi:hypothetical protein
MSFHSQNHVRLQQLRHSEIELINHLEHKMSMSHVYQPLLVGALVDAGRAATLACA